MAPIIYLIDNSDCTSLQNGHFTDTVTPRYNAVVGRHLLGPPYKRGALWDPVDLFDQVPGIQPTSQAK